MSVEQIYKELKEIVRSIHAHSDQIIVIAHWIESNFRPKTETVIKANPKVTTEKAEEFIQKCNVHGVVHAKEGGVINLSELLVDFTKFIEN